MTQSTVTAAQIAQNQEHGPVEPKPDAYQLAGNWVMTFKSTQVTGDVGVKAVTKDIAEFYGRFDQKNGNGTLKFKGKATIDGKLAHVKFETKSDKGEEFFGEGQFPLNSNKIIHGWYVDQNRTFDSIDLQRMQ